MKFKRIIAAILSVLMLSTMFVFTASAQTAEATPLYSRYAHGGADGFAGEAATGTQMYDAENDIVYYHFVAADKNDWIHFGWHNAAGKFDWTAPITVGMVMRTNQAGAVPGIRLCDRSDAANKLTIGKKAAAIAGNNEWEIVWFPTVTAADVANVSNSNATFDGLTHVQCFAVGESADITGTNYYGSDLYFDIAGYAFFNDTLENLEDTDLIEILPIGAPDVTLTFDAQNGTEVTTATVKNGTFVPGKVPFPAEPTAPEGKVFAGWATEANASSGVLEADIPGSSTIYYAIWAQDNSEPGDVTLKSLTINGTNASIFGLTDLSGETLTLNVPHNWDGDLVPVIGYEATDATATVTVNAGTFGEGSTISVRNGSASVTYNLVYNQAAATSKSVTPTGTVTSNPTGSNVPYKDTEYTVSGTTFISPARTQANAEIAGDKGTKITYNTKQEVVPATGAVVDDNAKTITGNANYYTIAHDSATPGFEGSGAYGFVTMSDWPWARVKYYIDSGEDGLTVARNFVISSTGWNNDAAKKGYAESTKKSTPVASTTQMVSDRWAYVYIDLASQFAQDYGYTYQFHFRPYSGTNFAPNNVMEVSADDPTVAVPHSTNGHKILFDDAFYLGSIEIFNEFPEADGLYAQIAPYEGLFTTTDETEVGANDGTITGLEVGMEYRLKGTEAWTAYEEPALAGELTLAPGTYEIRYAAIAGADDAIGWSASPATEVKINSALSATPNVTAVNLTAVDANDGKILGVDDTMSYRIAGDTDWTPVAPETTELTGLVPGAYEFIYLADGEIRTEDSEITTVYVLVDFDTDRVVYLTNNAANNDTTIFDGSSYEKAYAITKGGDLSNAIVKNVKSGESTTFVVIDQIDLGGWNENVASATASKVVFTGLTSDAVIGFACCNANTNTGFAMQHFGYTNELVFENITIDQVCLGDPEKHQNEHGLGVAGASKLVIADTVKSGANSTRVRIYVPQGVPTGSFEINGGNFEGIFSGVTYTTTKAISGANHTVTLGGGSVHSITATRHQDLWTGNYTVIVNGGEVRSHIYPGSQGGAYAGDAYVEINDGKVATVYTTAKAERQGTNASSTDSGIKNGTSVVVVNGGEIGAFALGAAAPGGSALIIGEDAIVPELTGAEADYVIAVANGGKVEAVLSEAAEYTYQPVTYTKAEGATDFTAVNNGTPITYTASEITGFKVTLPENYNTVKVNGVIIELTDGILALEALEADAVNEITFAATWTLKADLNGGNVAYDYAEDELLTAIFGAGYALESEFVEDNPLPNNDEFIKPYRSGYTLAGWALTPEATAEECVTFPYTMTGDTTFYAIWEEANDTPFVADEEDLKGTNYFVYATENADDFEVDDYVKSLGTVEKIGAYSVTVVDAANGSENEDAMFTIIYDAKDLDLDGKLLMVQFDDYAVILLDLGNGKYEFEALSSGIYLIYTLDPHAMYELEGTYYAKRNEYVVDIYLDSPAVNAGSIGLEYANTDFVDMTAGEDVQFIQAEASEENGAVTIIWGVADGIAYVGGDEKAHIATLTFAMTPEQRAAYIENGKTIQWMIANDIPEMVKDGYYLVAEHKANDLSVNFIPALINLINDTVGPDDMVTVKGTVEMTAREDGTAPIASNYATLYWRHKGAASYNAVVIENADTNTSVVEYTLTDVPADTEIEIYVEKNGYLTGKATFTFEAKTEDETDEQPERTADAIVLVPGDIKGNYNDACGDGIINIADFVRILRGFDEAAKDDEAFMNVLDIDENGDVNVTDLGFVKANFGATVAE